MEEAILEGCLYIYFMEIVLYCQHQKVYITVYVCFSKMDANICCEKGWTCQIVNHPLLIKTYSKYFIIQMGQFKVTASTESPGGP